MSCDIARKLEVVTDASVWPVSAAELKAHIRQSSSVGSVEDTLLSLYIASATVAVENHCGLSMASRTLRAYLGEWPWKSEFVLWYPTVNAISSVKYYDDANVLQTLDASYYTAELAGIRPSISLTWGKVWPVIRTRPFPVLVEYTTVQHNTDALKLAVMMMAADFYENRESQITSQYFGERSVIQNPAMVRLLNPYCIP